MGETLLSVIIPVYNQEKFLKSCLGSVAATTLRDIEVIVIDDGSTDGSLEIAHSFEKEYGYFKVISQENRGQSAARNAGLNGANGRYIAFLDSDDFIDPAMYERLYNIALGNDSELVKCGAVVFDNFSHQVITSRNDFDSFTNITSTEILLEAYLNRKIDKVVWNGIYHRRLFENIRFPEVGAFVDQYVTPHLLAVTNKYTYLPEALYYYRKHPGAMSHSRTSREFADMVQSLNEFFNIISDLHLLDELSYVFSRYFFKIVTDYHNQIIYSDPASLKRKHWSINSLIEPEVFEYVLKFNKLNQRQVNYLQLMRKSHYIFFLYQKFLNLVDKIVGKSTRDVNAVSDKATTVQVTERNRELIERFAAGDVKKKSVPL